MQSVCLLYWLGGDPKLVKLALLVANVHDRVEDMLVRVVLNRKDCLDSEDGA